MTDGSHSPAARRRSSTSVPPPSEPRHNFNAQSSEKHLKRLDRAKASKGQDTLNLQQLYLGLAATRKDDSTVEVGFCAHDGTYSIDFAVASVDVKDQNVGEAVTEYFLHSIRKYEQDHGYKFVGAGVTSDAEKMGVELLPRLWAELDIVALVFDSKVQVDDVPMGTSSVDEEADSMAREAIMFFGPTQQPRVSVGFRNEVEVDAGGHAKICNLEDFRHTVGERTWDATMKYAQGLKERKIKIAFFNSTPQGGGVALMRHALVRFLRLAGVNMKWYVPRPKPEVFRITKTNHNILQGVAAPDERLSDEQAQVLTDWCQTNAERFWLSKGGPLAARKDGGADFVVVDDPQLPNLVHLAKDADPDRPVIFRSHIQIRSDLADTEGSPTNGVWKWLHNCVRQADLFVAHPVKAFVPKAVAPEKVAYLPATTDWLDGLNKDLDSWDMRHYLHLFNEDAQKTGVPLLAFPKRDYIVQIARFDPAKGIPDVLASYAKLRREYFKDTPREQTPQLVIAGHSAIDDPDGTRILNETNAALENEYSDISNDIIPLRVGPTDQILNALMSGAKVALQLSTREGFEVKVSEALHKGIPTIATLAGGIPLQVEDKKSGFLVEPSDSDAVAKHLHELFTDDALYAKMSEYAAMHVSDEVSTVGNALSWLYLADTMTKGEKVEGRGRWVNDMAREYAGLGYGEGEVRLPRHFTT